MELKKRWLTRREAAEYTGRAESTLANLAAQGRGPRFKNPSSGSRGGKVLYDVADLDTWIESQGTEAEMAREIERVGIPKSVAKRAPKLVATQRAPLRITEVSIVSVDDDYPELREIAAINDEVGGLIGDLRRAICNAA